MSVRKLLLLLCLYQIATSVVLTSNTKLSHKRVIFDLNKAKQLFEDFIETYGKKYIDDNEYNIRLEIFTKHLRDANKRNKRSRSEAYGITRFMDLTYEEFVEKYTGLNNMLELSENNTKTTRNVPLKLLLSNAPEEWDWREQGVVSPVTDQGNCDSCWSFSAIGCAEGQHAIKYNKLYSLSTQQMIDCARLGGCEEGSFPHLAFIAAAQLGGFMDSKDYPYTGKEGRCKFRRNKVAVKVLGGCQLGIQTEEELKHIVYEYGPVSIGMHASEGIQEYKGGIAKPHTIGCVRGDPINHAVLLVGYGTEDGVPYWIIKQSYGESWGEDGYIRMLRGENTCNLLSYVATVDIA